MSIRQTVRTFVAAALVSGASVSHAQSTVPGWTYTMNITYDSGTGPANRGSMAMRYLTSANNLRMEIVQVAGAANAATAGVSVMDMRKMMARMPAGMLDSAVANQTVRSGGCR